ncbi:MAG: calcium/sodium antiporter [Eubacteriales bacterium]
METFLMYFLFAVGIVLIVKGGDWFVDGAVWVAEVTKIPKFIIGATIISVATTLPEIIVSTIAAVEGHGILVSGVGDYIAASQDKVGMAIGNGIGSVICNTAMILAISVIFMPIAVKRKDFAPKSILLIAAVVALFLFSMSGSFSLSGALVLILIFALYIAENIRSAKNNVSENDDERPSADKRSVILNILRVVIGAAGIVVGSQLLVNNGSKIAASWGVSEAIIGVTIVAIGTSLPELVTAVTAVVKKQASMSVGNVIGANVIDTTLILSVCSFVYGGNLPVSLQNIYLDFPVAIIVSLIAAVPTIICKKFNRWQGILMLAIYIAYLIIVTVGLKQYLSLFGVSIT